MTMRRLVAAGAALQRTIRADLPDHVELDPREEALLAAAARRADDVAALEAWLNRNAERTL